jgi:hypothetical protein
VLITPHGEQCKESACTGNITNLLDFGVFADAIDPCDASIHPAMRFHVRITSPSMRSDARWDGLIMFLLLVEVLDCITYVSFAHLQAPCVGIDLGTHSSSVAIFRNDNTEVLANDMGTHFTPSVIGFSETELLVGDVAVPGKVKDPTNTVVECKRLVGKKIGDEDVKEDAKRWPYSLIHDQNRLCVQVSGLLQVCGIVGEEGKLTVC